MVAKNTFILTTHRGAENSASSEIYMLLTEFGDSKAKITRTKVSGVLMVETVLSHQDVIEMLKKMIESEPWRARSMLRLIPAEEMVDADLNQIVEAVQPMLERIGEEETFRITVEKRHSEISRNEIIEAVASKTVRKVDLENPDWVVLIEVIGGKAGVSVVRPEQILSVVKAKRGDTR
ncbi:MAG: THUMP domain-containing protein [Nitrososphaerales archaeon]